MKKIRVSKRRHITCAKCGGKQSTYSTNRMLCHKCLPKCTETHTFENVLQRKAKQAKDQARAEAQEIENQ